MRFAPFRPHLWFIVLVAWLMPTSPVLAEDALPLEKIRLPPGFSIALWTRVDNPRQMALGARDATGGTVYVGSMRAGRVHAVRFDSRHQASGVSTVASGLTLPSGVAWRDGALYVAAVDRILRYADIDRRLANPPAPVVVRNTLPRQNEHGWKFIAFGPDGKLYVPVGAPCNSCAPGEPYASILRMDADGSNAEIYARGVRNSIGFDWDPADGTLWFTDNGRDWLGPDAPPAQKLGAHVAALGMRFYVGNQFPEAYRHSIFIAEHGSWNRWQKVGYRITRVPIRNGKAAGYEVFAEGWLEDSLLGGSAWGRPSDVLALPDGSLLVADDQANAIYRISWRGR